MTTLTPMYDRLLVRRDDPEAVSEGGIVIPEAARSRMNTGTVLRVGIGRLFIHAPVYFDDSEGVTPGYRAHMEPLRVKVGDKILFSSYAGTEVVLNKEPQLLLKEDEVLAVINEEVAA